MAISEGQWREVALSDGEYTQILELLGREPTPVELGMFGAMWSEHCGYKHSRLLLKRLPNDAPWVVQGPGENAGAVDIGHGLAAVFKVESHNHPSAVEPYEGAATGVGGIVRDIFTMNARPIAILNALRFGPLDEDRNRYLFGKVVAGIGGYGNCLGIPTVGGDLEIDASFSGNPIVNAMCVGVAPIDKIVLAEASGIGNIIVLIGARTGRDGLHGATFASVDDPEASHRGVVQVGNPFLEKQLMEACLELLTGDSVVAMQDLGAAGLTSSIVECASRGGVGVEIDVAHVPRRESNMTAYEIMLSESQERMVLVAPPEKFEEIQRVLDRWSLDSTQIGFITDTGVVRIRDGEDVCADVQVVNFIDDCPTYVVISTEPSYFRELQNMDPVPHIDLDDHSVTDMLVTLLETSNLGSRHQVWEQYDHTILSNTVYGPGEADAAVLRIKGTPAGLATSIDCNSRWCYLDPYLGAQHAVAEACRNVAATGARPLAITNCLNFGSPERSPGSWQLERAVAGMAASCDALGIPVVSGNVSLYNETHGAAIHPTPMVGCVGVLDDVAQAIPSTWEEGDTILLIGPEHRSLAGSEFQHSNARSPGGALPELDLRMERSLYEAMEELARQQLLNGAHDVGLGGLAVALAELAMCSGIGGDFPLPNGIDRRDVFWFGEGGSNMLVAAAPVLLEAIRTILDARNLTHQELGVVTGSCLTLGTGPPLPICTLRNAGRSSLVETADTLHA